MYFASFHGKGRTVRTIIVKRCCGQQKHYRLMVMVGDGSNEIGTRKEESRNTLNISWLLTLSHEFRCYSHGCFDSISCIGENLVKPNRRTSSYRNIVYLKDISVRNQSSKCILPKYQEPTVYIQWNWGLFSLLKLFLNKKYRNHVMCSLSKVFTF